MLIQLDKTNYKAVPTRRLQITISLNHHQLVPYDHPTFLSSLHSRPSRNLFKHTASPFLSLQRRVSASYDPPR